MPTTNGSAIMKDAIPPEDGSITKALRAAGAVILGKTAMGEFAGGSYNSVRGQTLNPYNVKRSTGGSSSGSGAAVSSNFGVLAVGTDTSTSVRGPASYTGIVGMRPTTGLISRAGIAPKNLNFDSAGAMARNVTDLARMMNAPASPHPKEPKRVEGCAELANTDQAEDGQQPKPGEDSVVDRLETSPKTSPDAPEYKNVSEAQKPPATGATPAAFERHGVDALVFPYVPTFGTPIKTTV